MPVSGPLIIAKDIKGETQEETDYETRRAINNLADKDEPDEKRHKQIDERLKGLDLDEILEIFDESWTEKGNKKGSAAYRQAKARLKGRWE